MAVNFLSISRNINPVALASAKMDNQVEFARHEYAKASKIVRVKFVSDLKSFVQRQSQKIACGRKIYIGYQL